MTSDSAPGNVAQLADSVALLERWLRDFAARLPDASNIDWSLVLRSLAQHPERIGEMQERYYRMHLDTWRQLLGNEAATAPAIETAPGDHRFDHPDWEALPWFRYLKQTYLINARWMSELLDLVDVPAEQRPRARFVFKQFIDALAPTNFAVTNPEALRLASETGGASLLQGVARLRRDLARGRIEMSDEQAFQVGRTLAVTPGAVVYQN